MYIREAYEVDKKIVAIEVPGGKRNLVKNMMAQQIAFNKTMMEK